MSTAGTKNHQGWFIHTPSPMAATAMSEYTADWITMDRSLTAPPAGVADSRTASAAAAAWSSVI
jgi:hypothetical protein